MNTFDGSKPNLIDNKIIKEIEEALNINYDENKLFNGVGSFYSNFIQPNLFPIIVISFLVIYLAIKYVIKKDREEKNKEKISTNKSIDSNHTNNDKVSDTKKNIQKISTNISNDSNKQNNGTSDNIKSGKNINNAKNDENNNRKNNEKNNVNNDENNNDKNEENTLDKKIDKISKKMFKNNGDEKINDIADLISDEYLLTDESEDDNDINEYGNQMINEYDNSHNKFDRLTDLVFGKNI
jgi:hypothetical protein